MKSDYERIGDAELREAVEAYVQRFAADFIIGFMFEGKDLQRIALHEYQLAASHLGASVAYQGRSLRGAHTRLPINAGHFRRRLAIVRTVLTERGIDADIIERWVEWERGLEAAVTDGTDCTPG